MNKTEVKFSAVIGGIAVVALGALGVAGAQQENPTSLVGSEPSSPMLTGETITATTAPSEPETPMAVPGIKGPAPLPLEEQGLPG